MPGGNFEIRRQRIHARVPRSVEQDTAANNRRHGVDGMRAEALLMRLGGCRLDAAEQLAAARKMTQGVNVRTHVAAQCQRIRRGTVSRRTDVLAVLLHQSEQKRRMRRVVRHAGKVGLRQIEDARAGDGLIE